ncbi:MULTISPECIES: hypothetical protein [unclassified Pseudomonas]|uniref:Lipoprotein n=1 Tax=Pseudomonas sp. MYb327 TaxID=2745230 RepID=A0AAU8E374_9PSED
MKYVLGLLSLALLTGCTTPTMDEMRQEEPRQVLHSKKTDKVIADCVQHAWQDMPVFEGESGATQEPGSNGGYTVATVGEAYFVDIQADTEGSVVKYYAMTYRWISRKHLAALQGCL